MHIKNYTDSALQAMTKAELIEHIRDLQHNWQVAEERCENQYNILVKLQKERCKNGSC